MSDYILPPGFHMSECGRFAERRIDRLDVLKTMAKLVGSDEDKSLTKDQSIVLSFLMLKTQGGAKPIASEDEIPKDLRVILFPTGQTEFRADGLRMPVTDAMLEKYEKKAGLKR
jgi:hypothetical protein